MPGLMNLIILPFVLLIVSYGVIFISLAKMYLRDWICFVFVFAKLEPSTEYDSQ